MRRLYTEQLGAKEARCALHDAQRHSSAQCTLHTDCWLASGLEKPILRRRRRPSQLHPRPQGSPSASCAAMWWHTPAPPLSSGLILSTMGCGSLQNGCDPLQGATDRAQDATGRLQPHEPPRSQKPSGAAPSPSRAKPRLFQSPSTSHTHKIDRPPSTSHIHKTVHAAARRTHPPAAAGHARLCQCPGPCTGPRLRRGLQRCMSDIDCVEDGVPPLLAASSPSCA